MYKLEQNEDFFERAYLIMRLIMKNIRKLKINKNFLKVSFLDPKLLFCLKLFISKIKKALYLPKKTKSKNIENRLGIKIHSKTTSNLTLETHRIGFDFLSKSANMILKYTEKCKSTSSKNQIFWKLNKFSSKTINQPNRWLDLDYKKAIFIFLRTFYNKKKFSLNKLIRSLLFFDCFCEYNSIYIF